MKLRSPWLIKLTAFLGSCVIRLWMSTVRYRMAQLDEDLHPTDARRRRVIYIIWHESILFPTSFRGKAHVLVSQHRDGELIARLCQQLGFPTVRGSTRRGGAQALLQLTRIVRRSHLVMTPDGPRGPRRHIQPGLIFLAAHLGLPIVPCGVAYDRAWRANSWDRFAVPRPWSTAYGVIGQAIPVPPHLSRKKLEEFRALVEQRMLAATEAAEKWAQGNCRPSAPVVIPEHAMRRMSA
jgi:lysophospholipid acyltransferase (LPLAT)-like uncharacterized protein